MKQGKKTQSQLDKEQRDLQLQQKLQKECNKKKISMLEFQKNWNLKNKQKITEMVKLNNTFLIRFGNTTIHCVSDKLYL